MSNNNKYIYVITNNINDFFNSGEVFKFILLHIYIIK